MQRRVSFLWQQLLSYNFLLAPTAAYVADGNVHKVNTLSS